MLRRHVPASLMLASLLLHRLRLRARPPEDASGTGAASAAGAGGRRSTRRRRACGTGGAGTRHARRATPTGSLVFQGDQAVLLISGPPCTWEAGATGDRWCAFIAASATCRTTATCSSSTSPRRPPACRSPAALADANCLKLTSTFAEDELHPRHVPGRHAGLLRRGGDAVRVAAGHDRGARARRGRSDHGSTCSSARPSLKGTAVVCLRDLPTAMQTDPPTSSSATSSPGRSTMRPTPPLARVETVISANAPTGTSRASRSASRSPAAKLAWSARATAAGPEILKVQTLGNDASRVTVASDVNSWRVSPDGTRWYWLSAGQRDHGGGGAAVGAVSGRRRARSRSPPTPCQYDFPTPTSLLAVVDTAKSCWGSPIRSARPPPARWWTPA